jgi:hypothetical protein
MKDTYPDTFELEIDRPALRRYLRIEWFLSWFAVIMVLGGIITFAYICGQLGNDPILDLTELVTFVASRAAAGLSIAAALSVVCYFSISHLIAARVAKSLRVSVDGAFLRIVQQHFARIDRKIHFRSIVDYSIVESPLMRWLGVKSLKMTTTGGMHSDLVVVGLADCERMRDVLAEIDSHREL